MAIASSSRRFSASRRCLQEGSSPALPEQRQAHGLRRAQYHKDPILKIFATGLGDYTHNVGYKTGSITNEYETHSFDYIRAIRLFSH